MTVLLLEFISVQSKENVASIRGLNSQGKRRKSKISFQNKKSNKANSKCMCPAYFLRFWYLSACLLLMTS